MYPELQYCFDCSVECGDLTADVAAYFRMVHPNPNAWYDDYEKRATNRPWDSGGFCDSALNVFLDERDRMPRTTKAALSVLGLRAMKMQINEMALGAANLAIDDALTEFTGRRRVQAAGNRARLRKICIEDVHTNRFINAAGRLIERAANDADGLNIDDAFKCADQLIDEHNAKQAILRDQLTSAFMNGESINSRTGMPIKITKTKQKKKRKMMAKSATFMRSVIGKENARMFVQGDQIMIEGRNYDFLVRPERSLGSMGHGSLKITLSDKDGCILCDLCVYWEDTPAMDQVAALAMTVAAGDEEGVLETANYFNLRVDQSKLPRFGDTKNQDNQRGALFNIFGLSDSRLKLESDIRPFVKRRATEVIYGLMPTDIRKLMMMTPICSPYENQTHV